MRAIPVSVTRVQAPPSTGLAVPQLTGVASCSKRLAPLGFNPRTAAEDSASRTLPDAHRRLASQRIHNGSSGPVGGPAVFPSPSWKKQANGAFEPDNDITESSRKARRGGLFDAPVEDDVPAENAALKAVVAKLKRENEGLMGVNHQLVSDLEDKRLECVNKDAELRIASLLLDVQTAGTEQRHMASQTYNPSDFSSRVDSLYGRVALLVADSEEKTEEQEKEAASEQGQEGQLPVVPPEVRQEAEELIREFQVAVQQRPDDDQAVAVLMRAERQLVLIWSTLSHLIEFQQYAEELDAKRHNAEQALREARAA